MKVIPVLFEDHTLGHFRPISWSIPTYEIRSGIFNLRERVGHLVAESDQNGILLSRPVLADLHTAPGWSVGPAALAETASPSDTVYLWINGRVGWDHAQLRQIFDAASTGENLHAVDDHGLLAFTLDAASSRVICEVWESWESVAESQRCWSDPTVDIPHWEPELKGDPVEFSALGWIWDLVPGTAKSISADLNWLEDGTQFRRHPFGILPVAANREPAWSGPSSFRRWEAEDLAASYPGAGLIGGLGLHLGEEVRLGAGVALDTSKGPIILDKMVQVMPNSFLEGPLYIGPGSTVKAGATIYGESSFGIMNKISGEIGESSFGDFTNKQHDGFIGHAVLGSWVNLGAMTTCSDLKNNYGPVRVDLGNGAVDSGQRFVGLLMGDHAKTAIGTLFNTGSCVGFASNIFGGPMPPKFGGNFSWGGHDASPLYALDKALDTARVVMSRRGCDLTAAHERLFGSIFG